MCVFLPAILFRSFFLGNLVIGINKFFLYVLQALLIFRAFLNFRLSFVTLTVERTHFVKNKTPVAKFLKDRGVGKVKLLSRSFLSPRKNINFTIPLFLWHKRRKEKAWQKENAVLWGYSPQALASFLKVGSADIPVSFIV